MYDYRQELIELLNHTTADPDSLLQTQRSLTTILNILNHYQDATPQKAPVLSSEKFNHVPVSCHHKHKKH